MKRISLYLVVCLLVGVMALAGCQQAAPETVEVTREVQVVEEVEVTRLVEVVQEVEVTRVVEVAPPEEPPAEPQEPREITLLAGAG